MKVIATKVGFDGKQIRNPGDIFDMPKGAKGSWFEPAAEAPSEPAPTGKVKGEGKDLV
jgi:hypothetical protein